MTSDEKEQGVDEAETLIRDGSVVIEERMNRRDGLVEYRGTVDADEGSDARKETPAEQPPEDR
ncbi:MAG: hypothetical protein H0W59_08245 [Chloroflexia bacterium]|nr:hypothetical protein [Chloroflexia bacterium]